jgi:biopolymer transport protein ExbB
MRFLMIISLMLIGMVARAGELEQAYQKEYAYLVAEKKALEQRLQELKSSQNVNLRKAKAEIQKLQSKFHGKQNTNDRLKREISDARREANHVENDKVLLETTLIQAKESLKKLNNQLKEKEPTDQQLSAAFNFAKNVMENDGTVTTTEEQFFLFGGKQVDGKIINIGRIAKYGVSDQGGGILAPAGNGKFKVWSSETKKVADKIANQEYPASLDIYLYDNADKAVDKEAEKGIADEISGSGLVGVVIILLGLAGIVLVSIRIYLLKRSSTNIEKIASEVNQHVVSGDLDGALSVCKSNISAAANVIAATLRNLTRDRDHIEDIISESILHESSYIDRFGSAILVIAAVAPLLGLLGTVTGMISTFDIITEFGTGDPKLLSSGISEALLTTKFGLVVAIPMLLVGNLLSNWARQIKDDLEQAALHMINTYKV